MAIYQWERAVVPEWPLTLEEAQLIVDDLMRAYGRGPVVVRPMRTAARLGSYSPGRPSVIRLRATGVGVVLHEAAHAIAGASLGHGPAWAGTLADLVARLTGVSHREILAAARRHRVRVGRAIRQRRGTRLVQAARIIREARLRAERGEAPPAYLAPSYRERGGESGMRGVRIERGS